MNRYTSGERRDRRGARLSTSAVDTDGMLQHPVGWGLVAMVMAHGANDSINKLVRLNDTSVHSQEK